MPPISPEQEQQIRQVLQYCGQQAEQMATTQFEVFQKGPNDYVTSIDAALDEKLSAVFTELFPRDGVITEENAESRKKFDGGYSRLWCIDPLDGTEDFIHGKRDYAVMVGLLQNYQPIAGWVGAPAYELIYHGGPDWGLFQSVAGHPPEPLIRAKPAPPSQGFCPVVIGNRDRRNFGAAIAQQIPTAQFYSLGSFGLKVMEVVLGRAGLYLYFNGRVKVWDTTGPLAIAKAAGLICCDLQGYPLRSTPDAINSETLAHKQSIVIGWPHYVEPLLPKLQAAVEDTHESFS
ncbi:3'(2'),5'-bisphosphate nucleotidase CysQ family protein [Leptothermofonsia sp. ETS-13]|uniref:3'(2'),5'-bisphosphate nucleotidase CysQ family protein n=1 Tax=Leptothermofonsia sp. ETS-13 TaxID=3035696 RepID=UPI003BA3BF65